MKKTKKNWKHSNGYFNIRQFRFNQISENCQELRGTVYNNKKVNSLRKYNHLKCFGTYNNSALKFMKQKLTEVKGKIEKCTIIFGRCQHLFLFQ